VSAALQALKGTPGKCVSICDMRSWKSPTVPDSKLWSDSEFRLLGRTFGSDFWVGVLGRSLGGYTKVDESRVKKTSDNLKMENFCSFV
jgi:hypothetical protein